jgi:hypothetical protein
VIIHIGDHYDFPSLSLYDKNKKSFEGRRYKNDVEAGNTGLEIIEEAPKHYNQMQRINKKAQYLPRKVWTMGNHEYRSDRIAEESPELSGTVGTEEIQEYWEKKGWEVHPFREAVDIDGVWYCHFMPNPFTGNPWGGTIDNRLKQVGNSFTMGHQQAFMYGQRQVGRKIQHGLVAGSFYLHDESYKGPDGSSVVSGNNHWRGIVLKNEVADGQYCLDVWDMNRLCRKYSGADSIQEYLAETYPETKFTLAVA